MKTHLNETEVRVLGSLVEKEITTPDYYPLTLNALLNACNQKSNRVPVVAFDETTVLGALDGLREKDLAWETTAGSRVPKYKQRFTWAFNLTPPEVSVICELMLRGPQTAGELRGRGDRLYSFPNVVSVEAALESLMVRDHPLVIKLPRQPGRKEPRYSHLLCGEPVQATFEGSPRLETVVREVGGESLRISRLEQEVDTLRRGLAELKEQFVEFRRQLD